MPYNRHGQYVSDPAWRQEDGEDIEEEDLDEFEEPPNEDAGIDEYYEDSQSPSVEDYLDTTQQAERLWGDEHRQRVRQ